jgi:septal ring factor EnvC (AmiA/AmiB activator)
MTQHTTTRIREIAAALSVLASGDNDAPRLITEEILSHRRILCMSTLGRMVSDTDAQEILDNNEYLSAESASLSADLRESDHEREILHSNIDELENRISELEEMLEEPGYEIGTPV